MDQHEKDILDNLTRFFPDYQFQMKPTDLSAGIRPNYRQNVKFGKELRDEWLHKYSILPGAVITFSDIAASREWRIIGTPPAASRMVDALNGAFFTDSYGIRHYGWEQFVSRLVNDWLLVGRAMYHTRPIGSRLWTHFEYIDPAYCYPQTMNNGFANWYYNPRSFYQNSRTFSQDEIFFFDNVKMGSSGAFIGRVAYLIPMANLDWLLRQHDTYKLDGRKVTEIFVVPEGMLESIEDGIRTYMTLAMGENPASNKMAMVSYEHGNMSTSPFNGKVEDLIGKIGISEVPKDFSRAELEGRYVREIAATLGLPIGQFWHDPRGTNRSLEQVQQERSTLKGPAAFIRSLTRSINNLDMTGGTPGYKAILSVEEETDNSSLKLKSEALKTLTEAGLNLNNLLVESENNLLSPEQWLGFFQRNGLVTPNMTLSDLVVHEENALNRSYDEIMLGQVRMDLNGNVIERRNYTETNVWEGNDGISTDIEN